ncbi:MAG: hypothetical protein ACE5HO_02620 [bacterium]
MKLKMMLCSLLGVTIVSLIYGQTATINKVAFPSSNHQVETTIAINPSNKNNLIAGAIVIAPGGGGQLAYYCSLDGGDTWGGNENFPSAGTPAGDHGVAMAVNPTGTNQPLYVTWVEDWVKGEVVRDNNSTIFNSNNLLVDR